MSERLTLEEQVAEIRRLCGEIIRAHPFTRMVEWMLRALSERR
jgi:hypothetical protein